MWADFNIDPMVAVVSVIENDKIFIIDEIQIFSSNTNEMIDEIKSRYPDKKLFLSYPFKARKTSAGGTTDLALLKNAGFEVRAKTSTTR